MHGPSPGEMLSILQKNDEGQDLTAVHFDPALHAIRKYTMVLTPVPLKIRQTKLGNPQKGLNERGARRGSRLLPCAQLAQVYNEAILRYALSSLKHGRDQPQCTNILQGVRVEQNQVRDFSFLDRPAFTFPD